MNFRKALLLGFLLIGCAKPELEQAQEQKPADEPVKPQEEVWGDCATISDATTFNRFCSVVNSGRTRLNAKIEKNLVFDATSSKAFTGISVPYEGSIDGA